MLFPTNYDCNNHKFQVSSLRKMSSHYLSMNNTSSRKSASSYSAPSVAPVSYSAPSYSASAHTAAPPVVVNSNDAAISAL
jgi:hypothetical protein